jgi:phytoene dehydrogenase-like protein
MMATKKAIVIGAGVGGLSTAIQLARRGLAVTVLEARSESGGLASGFTVEGLSFDYGPYILLDRPGLEWSFQQFGEDLSRYLELRRIDDIYRVTDSEGAQVTFYSDLDRTASEFEQRWPGSAQRYIAFVRRTNHVYKRLSGLLHVAHPTMLDLLRSGAWTQAGFLLRSLQQVLAGTGLPPAIVNAIGIWTHVAGQKLSEAPSPLAFVPGLFHTVGCYLPVGGIRRISQVMTALAVNSGVQFEFGCKVTRIRTQERRVKAIETDNGDVRETDVIVSNHSAVGTYLDLLDQPISQKAELEKLPLQSPGVCAYLAVAHRPIPPYLHFYLPPGDEPCRLLINPALVMPEEQANGWYPARLLSPMRYSEAERGGTPGQQRYLEKILAEDWWKAHAGDTRVLASQTPLQWASRFNLYRDSMNPVMTARFMRSGRMPHRSPQFKGLYFAGSSTHPGQWVSFCAISGILAANCVRDDLAR